MKIYAILSMLILIAAMAGNAHAYTRTPEQEEAAKKARHALMENFKSEATEKDSEVSSPRKTDEHKPKTERKNDTPSKNDTGDAKMFAMRQLGVLVFVGVGGVLAVRILLGWLRRRMLEDD